QVLSLDSFLSLGVLKARRRRNLQQRRRQDESQTTEGRQTGFWRSSIAARTVQMKPRTWVTSLFSLALLPVAALGQHPVPGSPPSGLHTRLSHPPAQGPAALLYVRFAGPEGLRAIFYEGAPRAREFAAPVTVGLRPGYIYRVQLTGFPDHPGVSLFPTLEVR